jgi:hypothetical protein
MASPARKIRNLLRSIGTWLSWAKHGHEQMEALYGANPNHLTTEQRMAEAGYRAGPGGMATGG